MIAIAEMDRELAVLGIAEIAAFEMTRALMTRDANLETIRTAIEKSVYWPEFCRAIQASVNVERYIPGGIGRVVVGWAESTLRGMAWWNEMTESERDEALAVAERLSGRKFPSAHDAWRVRQRTGGTVMAGELQSAPAEVAL